MRKGAVLTYMSVPGFPCIMSSYFSQGEQRGGFNICLYLVFPLSCVPTYGKLKKGMPVPSVPSTYRNANKGAVLCHVLLFIARQTRVQFLQMSVRGMLSFHVSQGESGMVFTYVCTWLSPCHIFLLITR